MRQYEITEENDWEGETFGYILNLTDEQYQIIKSRFEEDDDFECCSIEPSNYTLEDVKLVNKKSKNGYMDRLCFYKLKEDLDLVNCEYGDFPYKGNGMTKIKR